MLYVVTHAPDRNRPAEQAAFFKGVQALVVSKVSDYQSRCVVWMGDHNNVDNPHLDVDPPEAWRPHSAQSAENGRMCLWLDCKIENVANATGPTPNSPYRWSWAVGYLQS